MKHTLSILLASSSLLLTACGDDPDYDATFSGADDAHLMRAAQTGLGMDAFISVFIGGAYMSLAQSPDRPDCPSVETDGDATVIVGNCTTDDGTELEGSMRLENVPALFSEDPGHDESKPSVITFEGFRTIGSDGEWYFDGTVRVEPDGEQIVIDLETELEGIAAHSDLTLRCAAGDCTPDDGASVFVDGIGLAAVSGEWNLDGETPSGKLTLSGEEVFELDLSAASGDCVPYTIDGEGAGEICGDSGDQ